MTGVNEEIKEKGEDPAQEGSKEEETAKETHETLPQGDNATSSSGSSPPLRRPLTRSQTGTVAKRRRRDDSEERTAALTKRTDAPRKKKKSTGSQSSSVAPEESPSQSPATREVSLTSSTANEVVPQLEFYSASPTSEERVECRLPRSRASLPTPIPNLTKKSRGRRVPTQPTGNSDSDQKDQRLYVCTVTGCGKCFHRGEHLKRHIRSIHTHEKPFKCSFPLCQKYFNRHDNLLQHLKVHRDVVPKDDEPPTASSSRSASASTSALPPALPVSPPMAYNRERSYSPIDNSRSPIMTPMTSYPIPRTIYNAFPMPYHNPYPTPMPYGPGMTSDTISLIRNMAVSSLRTELPHSPGTDPLGGPLY